MYSDALTPYGVWNREPHPFPLRSDLYHLQPIGVGTPYVESLTSYIARLAQAHNIGVKTLVMQKILPMFGKTTLSAQDYFTLNRFWDENVKSLNGTTLMAKEWVQVMETLTLRHDLHYLTMLTWADVLPMGRVLGPERAWCPYCYEEWRKTGQIIYEPLLWSLGVVTSCLHHQRRLSFVCPYSDCQQHLSLLAQRSKPGFCSRCDRWLGIAYDGELHVNSTLDQAELTWQRWIVQEMGHLLATAPSLATPPKRSAVRAVVASCVAQLAHGNMSALARHLKVSVGSIDGWRRGRSLLSLNTVVHMCYRLGTRPLHFLTGDMDAVIANAVGTGIYGTTMSARQSNRPPQSCQSVSSDDMHWPELRDVRSGRQKRRLNVPVLQDALQATLMSSEIPPPSLAEVARRLNHCPNHLRKRFPTVCHEISARYRRYRKQRSAARKQQIRDEIRQVTFQEYMRKARIRVFGVYVRHYNPLSSYVTKKQ